MLEYSMNSLKQLSPKEACAISLECLSQALVEYSHVVDSKDEKLMEMASLFVPVLAFLSALLKLDQSCSQIVHDWIHKRLYFPSTDPSKEDSAVEEVRIRFTRILSLALFSRSSSRNTFTLSTTDATILDLSSAVGLVAANALNKQMHIAIESLDLKPEITLPLGLVFMSASDHRNI